MSFRRRLFVVFSLTVIISVIAIAWIVSVVTRRAFERSNDERTGALVAQFQREFNRRGEDIARQVAAIAASDEISRMALSLGQNSAESGAYLNEAKSIAENQRLDFLELLDSQGTIISSAQWPAKFGYKSSYAPSSTTPKDAFLKREDLPEGAALGLFAASRVQVGDNSLYVLGGRRLDKEFFASLELPAGMRAMFYQNLGNGFSPQLLIDSSGLVKEPYRVMPLVQQVQQQQREATALIPSPADSADDETVHAIPLSGQDHQLLGILLVANSRRPFVELSRHIRTAALLALGSGIVLAILFSTWAAARVTRPVEQLAAAAREVAGGNWSAQAAVTSSDELGELAEAFNRMTRELLEQKQRLVQAERVAAWRELARRLAHELKNPLFPLQLTVENLVRARQQSPEHFEEILQESSTTLLAELGNLKAIIGRFSEFSRMPQPQWQQVDLNEVVGNAVRLFQAQLSAPDRAPIECKLDLAKPMEPMVADPEMLHRAISNLVLNGMDAMPQGGTLSLRTRQNGDHWVVEIADSGTGLTPEECERIFTPYYTSKAHGTGLGLAIVQSVVSDHGGTVRVQSSPGRGTTFTIELPNNRDKLTGAETVKI